LREPEKMDFLRLGLALQNLRPDAKFINIV